MKTWKQYRKAEALRMRDEYSDVTLRECLECAELHQSEWRKAVEAAANGGEVFPASFLNTLDPIHRRYLAKHFRGCILKNYVFPECREL